MLLSKHCPHTGVVNFYDVSEPHIAIGSITKSRSGLKSQSYTWRFYALDEAPFGYSADERSAEHSLRAVVVKAKTDKRALELH